MPKNGAAIAEKMRALDDINADIDKYKRYMNYTPTAGVFEEEAKQAFQNVIGRLLTMRHALERELEILEKE